MMDLAFDRALIIAADAREQRREGHGDDSVG